MLREKKYKEAKFFQTYPWLVLPMFLVRCNLVRCVLHRCKSPDRSVVRHFQWWVCHWGRPFAFCWSVGLWCLVPKQCSRSGIQQRGRWRAEFLQQRWPSYPCGEWTANHKRWDGQNAQRIRPIKIIVYFT